MEALKYENLARSLFQTGRGDDPLGILTEASRWSWVKSSVFVTKNQAMVWCLLLRLRSAYLDSVEGQHYNFEDSYHIEEKIWQASSNKDLINALEWINSIAEELQLSEFPTISYVATNIK